MLLSLRQDGLTSLFKEVRVLKEGVTMTWDSADLLQQCSRGTSRKSEIPPVLLGIPWPALRGPLRNQFWKKRRPQPYWGGENSGNALDASNALNYRVWGIPAVLSREIPGNALRAFPEEIPEIFRNFFRKVPAVLGVWPRKVLWRVLRWVLWEIGVLREVLWRVLWNLVGALWGILRY